MIATDVVFVGAVATCQSTSTVTFISIFLFLSTHNEGFPVVGELGQCPGVVEVGSSFFGHES